MTATWLNERTFNLVARGKEPYFRYEHRDDGKYYHVEECKAYIENHFKPTKPRTFHGRRKKNSWGGKRSKGIELNGASMPVLGLSGNLKQIESLAQQIIHLLKS
jgi:hypothetical protein